MGNNFKVLTLAEPNQVRPEPESRSIVNPGGSEWKGPSASQGIKRYRPGITAWSPPQELQQSTGKFWQPSMSGSIASWGWSRSQGYGCSPFKAVRELGSERRETVRSLSAVGVGSWGELPLVREDRGERATGAPVVLPRAQLGSYARMR